MYDSCIHFRSLQFGVLTRPIGVVTLAFLLSLAPNSNVLAFGWSSVRVAVEKAGEVTESLLMPCAKRIADSDRFSMRECVKESWSAGVGFVKDKIETDVGSPSARVEVDAEDMLELLSKAADKLGSRAASDLASGALKGLRIARGINKGLVLGEAAGRIFEQTLDWKLKAQELQVQGILDEANLILETRFLKSNPEVAKNYLEILRSDGPRVADGVLRALMQEDAMREPGESRSADREADRVLARATEDNHVSEEEGSDSQSTLLADQDRDGRYDLGADERYVAVDGQGSDFRSAESELQEDAVASIRSGLEDALNIRRDIAKGQAQSSRQSSAFPTQGRTVRTVPDIDGTSSPAASNQVPPSVDTVVSKLQELTCNPPPQNELQRWVDASYDHLDMWIDRIEEVISASEAYGGPSGVSMNASNTELIVVGVPNDHPSKRILEQAARWTMNSWSRPLTKEGMIDTVQLMHGSVFPLYGSGGDRAVGTFTKSHSTILLDFAALRWTLYLLDWATIEYCMVELGIDFKR